MWFAGYIAKEEVGVACRAKVSNILCGMKIMSVLYKMGMDVSGFRIYLLSGSLNVTDLDKIKNLQNRKIIIFDLKKGKVLLAATPDGYLALRKQKISMDTIIEIQELEAYKLLVENFVIKKKGNDNHEN